MRQAFTLIEMMIAIVLFSLITLFLSSTLQSLHQNSSALKLKNKHIKRDQKVIKLLREDIQASDELKVYASEHFTSLELHTLSSIYNMGHTYIRWFVNPKSKQLIRSESAFKLSPPYMDEELHQVHLDLTLKSIQWFKAYQSKDKSSLLVAINFNNRDLFLELLTPQYIELTKSTSSTQ
jgi:prepilin-type N-terminal cleavage/methylation domain-containing protein